MPNDPTIKQPKQIIVEGKDEIRVFNSLSKHLGLAENNRFAMLYQMLICLRLPDPLNQFQMVI